jgi:hypothetical protein
MVDLPLPDEPLVVGELGAVERGVTAARREQAVVGAALDDRAVLDHGDLVRRPDRREPVGDHDRRAPFERLDQRLLHRDLRLGVQVCGGLVQDDHPRPSQEQAGDRQALAFAAREPVAALPHHRVQAVGQRGEQLAQPGAVQGVDQLGVGGVRGGVAQVGRDRVVEQVAVLGDDADRAAHGRERQVAHVDPAQLDGAAVDVVEPWHERRDR